MKLEKEKIKGRTAQFSLFHTIASNPGEEKRKFLYKIPIGAELEIKKIVVAFPNGTFDDLLIQILKNDFAVLPEYGFIQGDGITFEFKDLEIQYEENTEIKVYYKNLNLNEKRVCYVYMQGIIKSKSE